MKTVIENYSRKELFEHYNAKTNPFNFVTTRIDITNAYKYSRIHKNLYATLCYVFAKAINRVPAFLYSYQDGKFIKYNRINPNYTEILDNGNVAFIGLNLEDSLESFIESNKKAKEIFKEKQESIALNDPEEGEIWFSCTPWFKFTGVVVPFDKEVDITQIIWDKFEIIDEHVYINATIVAHHGYVDGSHIGDLINKINEELSLIGE